MPRETYTEKLLSVGYTPASEREEEDQEIAIEAFAFALRQRQKAQDEILESLRSPTLTSDEAMDAALGEGRN